MNRRKRIAKLVTILCAAIFIFGCSTSVFAANDLVGRGTGRQTTTGTTTRTGTTTYNGSGSTTGTRTVAQTSGTQSNIATGTYAKGDPGVRRVNSQVQTGVMDKVVPFLSIICAAIAVFWVFFHFQMNQVRYGKSEKYYKELLDFKVSCRL